MKLTNKKLIIFDLDGTLIDSVPDLANSINFTLNSLNKNVFPEATIRQWIGNGAEVLVKRALSNSVTIDQNLDMELYKKSLQIFLEHYNNHSCKKTTIYNGVKKTLEELKKSGYILTIVTNKPYKFIKPILDFFKIENLFEYYVGGDSLKFKKPNPFPLQHVCGKLNFNIRQSIMIGDSKNDIIAANEAKMDSIAVSYGYNYDEDISIYRPTFIIDSFKEILT